MREELKQIRFKKIPVLDKGHIKLLDVMGDENTVVESARISFGNDAFHDSKKDSRLRERLLADKHTSPFEMPKINIEIKCPIFVARQWFRHRFGNYNEESLRYKASNCEFYFPNKDQILKQHQFNKQGKQENLSDETKEYYLKCLKEISEKSAEYYKKLLELEVTRELSRAILPVNLYTRFIWGVDLKTLLHFINLRMDKAAQYEIRCYSEAIYKNILKAWAPEIYGYFHEHIFMAPSVSKSNLKKLKELAISKNITMEDIGNDKQLAKLFFEEETN